MLNMQEHSPNETAPPTHRPASPRYLSSGEIDLILKLLVELRETTQSCASHTSATLLIVEFGGAERLGTYGLSQCAIDQE